MIFYILMLSGTTDTFFTAVGRFFRLRIQGGCRYQMQIPYCTRMICTSTSSAGKVLEKFRHGFIFQSKSSVRDLSNATLGTHTHTWSLPVEKSSFQNQSRGEGGGNIVVSLCQQLRTAVVIRPGTLCGRQQLPGKFRPGISFSKPAF